MMTEENLSVLEGWAIALSAIALFVATMAAPRLSRSVTRDELAVANADKTRRISRLVTALTAVEKDATALREEVTQTNQSLEEMRSELETLTKERDTLVAQVAAANAKVQELDGKLQTTGMEAAKLKEFLSLQEIQKERDEAAERAKEAEDRIRQLTLELHRAGVWP
jgi:chromosome segregation ATPase